jgi:hypothetical protein
VLAFSVRAVALLLPAVVAWIVTGQTSHLLWRPSGPVGVAIWVIQLAALGTAVVVIVERLTRRILPLAGLFSLSLVFPDRAPSRFKAALRAGTIRNLQERLDEHRRGGVSDPGEVTERIVELVAALGRHERLTRGHTERVRAYADMIAMELGLPKSDRYLLQWSCLLHDIGKLAVRPEVLNKNGRPSDEEWQELRRHPEVGGEIVEPLAPWLGDWRLAASQHHERWDGGGYPCGLSGEAISIAGRIVAVADAYDVITSARSYKRPMSTEAARAELVRCAGTQFDPAVVRAFLNAGLGRTSFALGPLGWLRELATLGSTGASTATNLASALAISLAAVTPTALADQTRRPEIATDPRPGPELASTSTQPDGSIGIEQPRPAGGSGPTAPPDGSASPAESSTTPPSVTTVPTGASTSPTGTTAPPSVTTVAPTVPAATPTMPPATTSPPPGTTAAPGITAAPATTSPPAATTTLAPGSGPNAVNDSALAALGAATTINVLANDADPDGDLVPSSLAIVAQPAKGSASVSGNRIVYSPGSSVALLGSTSLTYRICDSGNRCDTASVTITVVLA